MTRATNLLWGISLTGLAYGVALWWFVQALGPTTFPTLLVSILGVPPLVAGLVAFRRNPAGRWWIAPIIAVAATSALILVTIGYFVMTMDRL